jgi:methylglutaconyl-CoA hydratase
MERLATTVDEIAGQLLSSGPEAVKACKELIRTVGASASGGSRTYTNRAIQEYTVKKIATLGRSSEAQEGVKAFLEKRKPSWTGPA